MKKIFPSFIAVCLFVSASTGAPLPAEAGTPMSAPQLDPTSTPLPRALDPTVVSIGKELPRGNVVSHPSKDDAIRNLYHRSEYLQPLARWIRTETDSTVVYKTSYKIPFGWIDRREFLYVGKVSSSFGVSANGTPVGYAQTGSIPSEFDITAASHEGTNRLEITIYKDAVASRLQNRPVPPPAIEGEVYILSQPRMRVRDIFVDTRMEGTSGIMQLGVIMKSHSLNPADYTVYYELLSPRGEILSEGHKPSRLDMRREDTVRFFANIRDIVPWSHEEPRLYTLLIKTQNEGRFREYLSFRVGFRSLELRDSTLVLNGVPLPISMRPFTPTSDIAADRARIEALQADGVNALRLCGTPPSDGFYSLADELGIYLCNRADIDTRLSGMSRKVGGNPSNQPEWKAAYLDRIMGMYHTSKNHPSMAMFSLADSSANGYNLYEGYLALKATEHRRPVLYTDGGEWNTDRLDTTAFRANARGENGKNDEMGEVGDGTSNTPWAVFTAEDVASGQFLVANTRRFTPITGNVEYRITVGRKTVSAGSLPLRIMPSESVSVTIPITGVKSGKKFTVSLEACTERSEGVYTLSEEQSSRRIFRNPHGEPTGQDKEIIGRAEFSAVFDPPATSTTPATN